mmetsp:Transcript_8096/g.13647  ORF Transcript_8096/g.13647 Transcript_8096/m.13647 type:complete len:214 (-) Transcript_8096:4-645(-)
MLARAESPQSLWTGSTCGVRSLTRAHHRRAVRCSTTSIHCAMQARPAHPRQQSVSASSSFWHGASRSRASAETTLPAPRLHRMGRHMRTMNSQRGEASCCTICKATRVSRSTLHSFLRTRRSLIGCSHGSCSLRRRWSSRSSGPPRTRALTMSVLSAHGTLGGPVRCSHGCLGFERVAESLRPAHAKGSVPPSPLAVRVCRQRIKQRTSHRNF